MLQRHVRVFLPHFQDRLPPQTRAFQDIGLVDAQQAFAAAAGQLEGYAGDPLHLKSTIAFYVECFQSICSISAATVAEIDTAGQFTDDQDVDSLGRDIRMQRAGIGKRLVQDGRSEVGEKAHLGPKAQECFLRTFAARKAVPTRSADRSQKHGIASFAGHDRGGRQGFAGRVDGDAAGQKLLELKIMAVSNGNRFKDGPGAVGNFRTDAVSGDDGQMKSRHERSPC